MDYDAAVGQFYCDYLKDAGPGSIVPGEPAPSTASSRRWATTTTLMAAAWPNISATSRCLGRESRQAVAWGRNGTDDFIQGPVHFFVIDSMGALDSRTDMAAQKEWLKAGLAASPTPWQIVLLHHAPYSSGIHGSTAAMQWPYQAWGADAVLAGHDHDYERLQIGTIPYFVNGLGGTSRYPFLRQVAGSQARYSAGYGAMRVTASETEIVYDFISPAGTVIDSYTQSRLPPSAAPGSSATATPTAVSSPVAQSLVGPASEGAIAAYPAAHSPSPR